MTCCETVTFCVCTDCEDTPEECYDWELSIIEGPANFTLDDMQLIPEDYCNAVTLDVINCPKSFAEVHVKVTDICNNLEDEVYVYLGRVALGLGKTYAHPGSQTADIDLLLGNPENHVRAIQVDICADEDYLCKQIDNQYECEDEEDVVECVWDEENSMCIANDNIVCTACMVNEDRTPEYICSSAEITDPLDSGYGCCRVALYSTEPGNLIQQKSGTVATIKYDIGEELTSKDQIVLWPYRIKVSDQFNEYLCACPRPGKIEFRICGDVYPQDCYECQTCGDGIVDIFDILEEIDIILDFQTASECQKMTYHGDVPLGMPPYCGNPAGVTPPNCETDGIIDIFDVLVIIDKAMSKKNCCDYCMFGNIY